jgi:hypothetical protein
MVCVVLGMLLMCCILALLMYTANCFFMMGNYVALDGQSRNAADVMGREIRDSSALLAFGTNSPAYLQFTNATSGSTVTFTYYTSNGTLVFAKTGQAAQTLLTNCNYWTFSLFNRAPSISSTNITFYAATNSTVCKLVDLSWECSRQVRGSKINTESVQTAQIMLRNKVN